MFTSLAIAIVAMALEAASWLLPHWSNAIASSDVATQYSQTEIDQAQTRICHARSLIATATQNAGSQSSEDPTVSFIIAVNVRLGATSSADYLSQTVMNNPAAPEDLAIAARELVAAYQETTLLHLSDASESELDAVYEKLDAAGLSVDEACGD